MSSVMSFIVGEVSYKNAGKIDESIRANKRALAKLQEALDGLKLVPVQHVNGKLASNGKI